MRAYIYQARDILGLDSEGVSDAYAHVCFQNVSAPTRIIKETLCPDWDQTLVFEEMPLFGSPAVIAENPPLVFVELYDKDKVVSNTNFVIDVFQPHFIILYRDYNLALIILLSFRM